MYRVTHLAWFTRDCPGFSTASPTSLGLPRPQANRESWSPSGYTGISLNRGFIIFLKLLSVTPSNSALLGACPALAFSFWLLGTLRCLILFFEVPY